MFPFLYTCYNIISVIVLQGPKGMNNLRLFNVYNRLILKRGMEEVLELTVKFTDFWKNSLLLSFG